MISAVHDITTADDAVREQAWARPSGVSGVRVASIQVNPTTSGPGGKQLGLTVEVEL